MRFKTRCTKVFFVIQTDPIQTLARGTEDGLPFLVLEKLEDSVSQQIVRVGVCVYKCAGTLCGCVCVRVLVCRCACAAASTCAIIMFMYLRNKWLSRIGWVMFDLPTLILGYIPKQLQPNEASCFELQLSVTQTVVDYKMQLTQAVVPSVM